MNYRVKIIATGLDVAQGERRASFTITELVDSEEEAEAMINEVGDTPVSPAMDCVQRYLPEGDYSFAIVATVDERCGDDWETVRSAANRLGVLDCNTGLLVDINIADLQTAVMACNQQYIEGYDSDDGHFVRTSAEVATLINFAERFIEAAESQGATNGNYQTAG